MFRQFITDPDAFITERVTTRSARIEILVVLLVGALGSLGTLYLGLEVLDASEADEMSLAVTAFVIRPLFLTIALWLGYSVLFHFASRFFDARGQIRRLFTGFAWAFVPLGIGNLVQTAAIYVVVQGFTIDDQLDGTGPSEQLDSVIAAVTSEPIMIAASVLFLGTVAWTAYLMTFVLTQAKTNLSRDEAVKLVVPVVGIHIAFGAWAIVSGTSSFALLL